MSGRLSGSARSRFQGTRCATPSPGGTPPIQCLPVVLATSIRSSLHATPTPGGNGFYPCGVALVCIYAVVTPPHTDTGWHVLLSMSCGRDAMAPVHADNVDFCDLSMWIPAVAPVNTALHESACDCMPRMCTNISHTHHVKHRPLGIRGFPLSATLNTHSGLSGFIRGGGSWDARINPDRPG